MKLNKERLAELPQIAKDGATTQAVTQSSVFVKQFQLEVVAGHDAGAVFLSQGKSVVIGTHRSATVCLTDPAMSRFHVQLDYDNGAVRAHDLGSKNGTFVDGVDVTSARLRDGNVLTVGRSKLRFVLNGQSRVLQMSEQDHFGALVGNSLPMRQLFHELQNVAAMDSTVLISGETGTGKGLLAESLHNMSPRKNGPFIVVDCGALATHLVASELFGHEKGAFTGAIASRIGAFEAADQGTLFLDELGELPLDLQPLLLRVLENNEIRRVGSNEARPVDVRVIAATNRDLRRDVNSKRFRSDLYYRLAVVEVEIPPLRTRKEDLPLLVAALISQQDWGDDVKGKLLGPQVMDRLIHHDWPGNVRELGNFLQQAALRDSAEPLAAATQASLPAIDGNQTYHVAKERWLQYFEIRYIQELVRRHQGNVSQMARYADTTRLHLYKLMRKAGLK